MDNNSSSTPQQQQLYQQQYQQQQVIDDINKVRNKINELEEEIDGYVVYSTTAVAAVAVTEPVSLAA